MEPPRLSSTTIHKFEQFLIPPALLEDEDSARVVRPLVAICVTCLVVAILSALLRVLIVSSQNWRAIFPLLALIPAGLPLILIRFKLVRFASHILLGGFWLIVAFSVMTGGGTRSPIFALYILIVIISALLSGWRLASNYAFITVIFGYFLAVVDTDGAVMEYSSTPMSAWLAQSSLMIVMMGAVYFMLRQREKSLERANNALAERKKMQQELVKSEERFRLISSVASDYTFSSYFDEDGKLQHMLLTGAFEPITGYTPEEFLSIGGWQATVHPDDVEQDKRDMAALGENKRVVSEVRIINKSGAVSWVRVYAQPVWDSQQNKLVGINGGVQDITERKHLENQLKAYADQLEKLVDERTAELRRAKEQLELVLNNVANALAFADSDGDILVTNPAFHDAFSDEGIQHIETILDSLCNEDHVKSVSKSLLLAIYDNQRQRIETQIVSDNGEEKDIDLVITPVGPATSDSRKGVLVSGHDITQFKEIQRFKARFVADAVHDLATPITGLSTRLYLLKRTPEKLDEHMRALDNQVEHLINLLENLRTLSRMDRGQVALDKQLCDINTLVRRVFDTYEPVAIGKQQSLLLRTGSDSPQVLLDRQRFERVLVNIVSNAVNYTPENEGKEISIETSLEEKTFVIRVSDQGSGISAEDLPHIFDRFYRADDARMNRTSGTGLGLAIAKEIVEMHGGTVTVTSEVGQGSQFTVRMPLKV
jgi:PAS domain S-box-containing protein